MSKKQTFTYKKFDAITTGLSWSTVAEARADVFSTAGLAYQNDSNNYDQIQWALVDNATLKMTVSYGGTVSATDWAPGVKTLHDANNWYKMEGGTDPNGWNNMLVWDCTELTGESDHLF